MNELTLDEISLLEEMKSNCLKKGQYIDDKAKDKFKMLCHLEDFSIAYYELLEEKGKEIERLKEELKYTVPVVEYNKTITKHIKEKEQLHSIIKEVREWAKKCSCQFTNDDEELVVSEISFNIQARPCDLFKILDKVDKEKQ